MSNIKNHNFRNISVRVSNSDYWDFYLSENERDEECCLDTIDATNLVVHIDFDNTKVISGNTLYSLSTWSGAINSGVTLNDIGLTGVDNGFVTFNKTSGDTGNTAIVSALTQTTLTINSADTRMFFTKVSGNTGNYTYTTDILPPTTGFTFTGDYGKFCGGFYQGFFNLQEYDYQVLPKRVNKGWTAEFWLRKYDYTECLSGNTLNNKYPDNKGMFFYMGTRAEDKFWNCFDGVNTGDTANCSSGSTEYCTITKETNSTTSSGIPLCPSGNTTDYIINNKFLIYNRTHGGYTVCNFTGDTMTISKLNTIVTDTRNKFTTFNRACSNCGSSSCGGCKGSGATDNLMACSYSGDTMIINSIDPALSIIDNAIGFRIKDDGSIGVRVLTYTASCVDDVYITGTSVNEEYSIPGLIDDKWKHVVVKFIARNKLDDCDLNV